MYTLTFIWPLHFELISHIFLLSLNWVQCSVFKYTNTWGVTRRTWKNARNKEYASLFMEAHGGTRWLARFIEFNFSDQHAICLNSRNREFEVSVAQTFVCSGRRGNCPILQRVGPSMLCNMLGERSQKSLHLLILRDLPHTYSCTCFYSKGK